MRLNKKIMIILLILLLVGLYFSAFLFEYKYTDHLADRSGGSETWLHFSHEGGFYHEPFQLQITSPLRGATIYYTLDGSEPSLLSSVYSGPITIKDRSDDANVWSAMPLSDPPERIGWKPPLSPVFKGTVVRAIAVAGNEVRPVMTQTYWVDEKMAHPYHVPVVSLVIHPDHLFSEETGLFMDENPLERGIEWERPAHIAYFEPDGTQAFAQDIGVRIHGGASRMEATKSLRIYARQDYGKRAINYQLFPDKEIDEFERFILRYRGTNFRDEFQAHLVKDMVDIDLQYYRTVILFINGEYWGVYTIRDRFDDNYIKTHYGIKEIDMLSDLGEVSYGDQHHYEAMIDYIVANEDRINELAVFEHLQKQMDIANFRDFTIIQNYMMNVDQPGKNVDFWRSRTVDETVDRQDGLWRWMLYDLDASFGAYGGLGMNGFIYNTSLPYHGADTLIEHTEMNDYFPRLPSFSPLMDEIGTERTFLLRALLKNDTFRHDYLNRYSDFLNTGFQTERVLSMMQDMIEDIAPLVEENAMRAGAADDGTFDKLVASMTDFAERRPSFVRQFAMDYFPEITGMATVTIDAEPSQGVVQVNTLTIDDQLLGINDPAYPWEGVYFSGIPIEITAIPKPGYAFAGWEGSVQTTDAHLKLNLTEDTVLKATFISE